MTLPTLLRPLRPALALLITATLIGCAQQAKVTGSWQQGASRDQSFNRVLVVGVSPNASGRCDFESFMTNQIRAVGADAKSSCMYMKTTEPLTVEAIEAAVAEFQADAVLATVLVGSHASAEEGGSSDTRGAGFYKATDVGYTNYYNSFYPGYYGGGYGVYGVPVVYGEFRTAPTVTTIEGDIEIRSMLYAASDASMVYELFTSAKNLHSRDDALITITPPIAGRLQREGLLRVTP